jgi:hypothetical protein
METDYIDWYAAPGIIYYYWVKAATSISGDNESPYSGYDTGYSYMSGITNPTVITVKTTNITETSATLYGNITNTGGENCNERGFFLEDLTSGTVLSNMTSFGSTSGGEYILTRTTLTPGHNYRFAAYADNSYGRGTGDWMEFTTITPPPTKTLTSLTVSPDTMSFTAAGQQKAISEITLGWSDGSTSYLAKGDATYSSFSTSVAKIVMAIPSVYVQSVGTGSTNVKVSYTYNGVTKYDYIMVTVTDGE